MDRLSPQQITALRLAAASPQSCQAWGYGRRASIDASAWNRTYDSLWGRELVENPIKVVRRRETRSAAGVLGRKTVRVTVFVPMRVHGVWIATDAGRELLRAIDERAAKKSSCKARKAS